MRASNAIARRGVLGAALGLMAWPAVAELTIAFDGEGNLLLARPCATFSQAKDMPDPIALFFPALGCVNEDRPVDAARLFLLKDAWLNYDARRFGSQELQSSLEEVGFEFDRALPEGRRSAAKAPVQRFGTGVDFSTWCRNASALTSPKHGPDYLKINAELPDMSPLQTFEPAALWRKTHAEDMQCPS